jgi:hypothetical protein
MSKSVKRLTSILEKVDNLAKDADELRSFVKYGIIYLKNIIFGKRAPANKARGPEGGDKDGK